MAPRKYFFKLFFGLTLASYFGLMGSVALALDLTEKEKDALASGKVVKRIIADNGKDRYFGGTGMAVIPESAEAVWTAIQDYPSYPRIFSNTYETIELSRLGGKSLIRMKLGHPIISVQYHVEMSPQRDSWTLSFQQIASYPNDLEDIRGYWRLVPMGDHSTLLMYVVGVKVPDGIIRILPDAFKEWALDGVLSAPSAIRKWMARKGETPASQK